MPLRKDPSLANVLLIAYSILICAATFLALVTIHVGSWGAPYWDEWSYIDPRHYLPHLFRPHNMHPLATGKLLFAVDYYLFSGRGNFLRVILFLELAVSTASAVMLARLAGIGDRLPFACVLSAGVVFLFSPFAFENLVWGFQVAWVAGIAGPALSVAALAMFAERGGGRWLALSYAALVVGMFGLARYFSSGFGGRRC